MNKNTFRECFIRNSSKLRDRDGQTRYKRSDSDDVYERLLKYNNESIKRAIKDGYRNFIKPQVSEENPPANALSKPARKRFAKQEIERVTAPDNNEKLQVNTLKHNKYITRTSKAGTLVIKEESFDNLNWRRRRTLDDCVFPDDKVNNARQLSRMQNFRNAGDPNVSRKTKQPLNRYTSVEKTATENKSVKENVNKPQTNSLFHSKSAACVQSVSNGNNSDLNANYMVHEPTTPSSEQSRKGSEQLAEKIEPKKRRKIRRSRRSDDSTTSSSQLDNLKNKRNPTKGNSTIFQCRN